MVERVTTWEEYLKDTNDQDLMREALALDDLIHNIECFGSKDVIRLDGVCGELERRGYEVKVVQTLVFTKDDKVENTATLYNEIKTKGE